MKATSAAKAPFADARAEREAALRGARRRLILDGAWRAFAEQGLDGATMRSIAAAAGCTTGAVYPLFPSKEAVYAALLAESLDRLHSEVAAAVRAASGAPESALRAGAAAFLLYYRDRPDEVTLGLYLWNGVQPRGLSRDFDRDLNVRLGGTLALLEGVLASAGRLDAAVARTEVAALFAFLIGALVLHQTGRLGTLGRDLDAVAKLHVERVISDLVRDAG